MYGAHVTVVQVMSDWIITCAVYQDEDSGHREGLASRVWTLPGTDEELWGQDLDSVLSVLQRWSSRVGQD